MDSRSLIPEEIRSKTYLGYGILLQDLVVIVMCYYLFDKLKGFVHPAISIGYTIFTIVIGIIITRPSYTNPGRKIFHSILYYFLKDKKEYHGI